MYTICIPYVYHTFTLLKVWYTDCLYTICIPYFCRFIGILILFSILVKYLTLHNILSITLRMRRRSQNSRSLAETNPENEESFGESLPLYKNWRPVAAHAPHAHSCSACTGFGRPLCSEQIAVVPGQRILMHTFSLPLAFYAGLWLSIFLIVTTDTVTRFMLSPLWAHSNVVSTAREFDTWGVKRNKADTKFWRL